MEISKNQVTQICQKLKEEFVQVKFLARGNHNESYFLKTKTKDLVLRIENNNQFKNIKKEYKFLKLLDGKISPKVYLIDTSRKIISNDYMIQEFIEGKHPERKVDNNFIELMAKFYRKLHSNKQPINNNTRNLLYRFINYEKNIRKYWKEVSIKIWKELETIFEQSKSFLDKNLLSKRKYLCLNHGDPTRSNVFYDKNSVRLIDWEFVDYNHPEEDLVFFKYSYDLTDNQWNLFLEAYKYKKSKYSEILFNQFLIVHYIGMINWRFERLYFISTGKADLRQSSSNKNKMITEIKEDLMKIKQILK